MARKPLWRQAYDAVDSRVAPHLESMVQTPQFAEVLSVLIRTQGRARRGVERQSRRLWHLVNLPAGSDVTRLRDQVVSLDRQVRSLTTALEEANRAQPDRPAEPGGDSRRHGQPRAAGGRTQRAART
jgi:hypothetical protein